MRMCLVRERRVKRNREHAASGQMYGSACEPAAASAGIWSSASSSGVAAGAALELLLAARCMRAGGLLAAAGCGLRAGAGARVECAGAATETLPKKACEGPGAKTSGVGRNGSAGDGAAGRVTADALAASAARRRPAEAGDMASWGCELDMHELKQKERFWRGRKTRLLAAGWAALPTNQKGRRRVAFGLYY